MGSAAAGCYDRDVLLAGRGDLEWTWATLRSVDASRPWLLGYRGTRLGFDAADAVAAYLAGMGTGRRRTFVGVNDRSWRWCSPDPAGWFETEGDLVEARARWARAPNGFMMAVGVPLA